MTRIQFSLRGDVRFFLLFERARFSFITLLYSVLGGCLYVYYLFNFLFTNDILISSVRSLKRRQKSKFVTRGHADLVKLSDQIE